MFLSRSKLLLFLCFVLAAWPTWAVALEDEDFQSDFREYDSRKNRAAMEYYLGLAEKNDPHAQYMLGRMYAKGQRLERDYLEAYIWLHLAEMKGVEDAAQLKDTISRQMSGWEIAEAHRRIEQAATAWCSRRPGNHHFRGYPQSTAAIGRKRILSRRHRRDSRRAHQGCHTQISG